MFTCLWKQNYLHTYILKFLAIKHCFSFSNIRDAERLWRLLYVSYIATVNIYIFYGNIFFLYIPKEFKSTFNFVLILSIYNNRTSSCYTFISIASVLLMFIDLYIYIYISRRMCDYFFNYFQLIITKKIKIFQ